MTRVAIQGIPGAFSQTAAEQLFQHVSVIPRVDFRELIKAVVEGDADFGVVPIENTLAGSVQGNLELIRGSGLVVVAETMVKIELCLIALPGTSVVEVRTAASHPLALEQCRQYFDDRGISGISSFDTAGSVEGLLLGQCEYDAAVAGRVAAELYGAEILAEGIEDDPSNFTRFLAVSSVFRSTEGPTEGPTEAPTEGPPVGEKATISFVIPHRRGSLTEALSGFAREGLSLMRLESWPRRGKPWEYRFFADLRAQGGLDLRRALKSVAGDLPEMEITILGVYPACARTGTYPWAD